MNKAVGLREPAAGSLRGMTTAEALHGNRVKLRG